MDESVDYRSQYNRLKNENQYLKLELEEFQFRERNLKKELEIMSQINQQRPNHKNPQKQQMLNLQNQQLKQQLLIVYKQKQQLQSNTQNYLQKINDLKYNNGELKNLNQKLTQLHYKEIEMIKKEREHHENGMNYQDRERKLMKEREMYEKKLESCAEIAKEMENYYTNQIRKLKDAVKNRDEDIRTLTRELQGTKTQRLSQGENSIKQCNEKWEKVCNEIKEEYESQIKELRSKVKFLINKLQNMQDNDSKQSICSQALIQSKMLQSNSSIDSFRFTPNSSVSSNKDSIQPPTRRNTSGIKAPSTQPQKMGKSYVPLAQRNNY